MITYLSSTGFLACFFISLPSKINQNNLKIDRIKLKLTIIFISLIFFTSQVFAQKKISDSLSYAMGSQIAESMKQGNLLQNIDFTVFVDAMKDVLAGNSYITREQSAAVITAFLQKEYESLKANNLATANAFLEQNKTKEGVVVLPSGLQYVILKPGNDKKPTETDEVVVNYQGTMLDGTVFDSSYERGEPATFNLGRLIPGWKEGLQYIGEGGEMMLFIPPGLAYG